jgi:hypothetical protein
VALFFAVIAMPGVIARCCPSIIIRVLSNATRVCDIAASVPQPGAGRAQAWRDVADRLLILSLDMPREIHRIVQYPQHVNCPIWLAADPEQNDVPSAPPHMQCAQTRADLIALSRPVDGRPALQASQGRGQQVAV